MQYGSTKMKADTTLPMHDSYTIICLHVNSTYLYVMATASKLLILVRGEIHEEWGWGQCKV